jgi:RecA-family ATPase
MEIQFVETSSLPPERAEKLRRILDDVRVAPPSEKLTAFGRAARRTAREIVCPTYPRREAVDRLWTTAEVHGLPDQFGENIIQSELAAAFEARDDDGELIGQSLVEEPPPPSSRNATIIPATFITPAAWPDEPPAPVDWLAADRAPRGEVTTLHGDGGAGKTDIAIGLAANVARRAQDWLGHAIEAGPVVFVSAEEPERELRRRAWLHAEHDGYNFDAISSLHLWFPDNSGDAVLAVPDDRTRIMRPTPLMCSIVAGIESVGPALVVVDNVAATFAGNQNDRVMVRSYVNLWRAVARGPSRPAVLLLDHPSLSGLTSGTGRGGNMDWRNAVRSALWLHPSTDTNEAERGIRILETVKSNYGPPGNPLRLQWADGGLQLEHAPNSLRQLANDAKCEEMFLRLLDERIAQRRDVSDKASKTYAPKVFAELDDNNGGFSNREFAYAMERLFRAGKIALERVGPPSDRRNRIVRTASAAVMGVAE